MNDYNYSTVRLKNWQEFRLYIDKFSENCAYRGQAAWNYLTKDDTLTHLIEWQALTQHHVAPTRLLDLTKSPFISAYFAFELCLINHDSYVAIWRLNVEVLKNSALDILSKEFKDALKQSQNVIDEGFFEKVVYHNKKNLLFPVEPFRMNRRYSLQQSIFVSTGTSKLPLMDQLLFLNKDFPRLYLKLK